VEYCTVHTKALGELEKLMQKKPEFARTVKVLRSILLMFFFLPPLYLLNFLVRE
jgi:hypothetical protein